MVGIADVFLHLPAVATALWLAIAVLLWSRRPRTAPEKVFALATLFIGLGALADWAYLNAQSRDVAGLGVNLRSTIFSVVSLLLLYFGRWLARSRSLWDLLPIPVLIGSVAIAWTAVTVDIVDIGSGSGPTWIRDPLWYGLWIAQVAGFLTVGYAYIGWTLRHATFASDTTRRKLLAILATFIAATLIWLGTTAYRGLTRAPGGLVSTWILLIPGVAIVPFLASGATPRLRAFLQRMTIAPSRPFAAILFHNSGVPMAQIVLPGEKTLELSVVGDLTRAVDHVVTKGLQSEEGTLREMEHGEYRFVFEQGKHVTLTVMLRGRPSEWLRSEMRMAVRDLEATFGEELENWESAASHAEQALVLLEQVLSPTIL